MRMLWRTYDWSCKECGTWQYEARVPGDRSVREYAPEYCRKCGGIQMNQREKGEKIA
jgi:hypothetical protein